MFDVGILGGMGTEATSLFFNKICNDTYAECDQEHLNTILLNVASIPDRTTSIKTVNNERIICQLADGIKMLNQMGCECITIPCNTSHYYYEYLQSISNIEILNMISLTMKYVYEVYPDMNICILGTLGTVESKIYEKYANNKVIYPEMDQCNIIQDSIYKIKNMSFLKERKRINKNIMNIIERISERNRNTCFVIGCTELSLLEFNNNNGYRIIDALDILAIAAVIRSGKKINEGNITVELESMLKIIKEQ